MYAFGDGEVGEVDLDGSPFLIGIPDGVETPGQTKQDKEGKPKHVVHSPGKMMHRDGLEKWRIHMPVCAEFMPPGRPAQVVVGSA